MHSPSEGAELERMLEYLECSMYADLYSALPAAIAKQFGMDAVAHEGSLRMTAARIDHPFFNRVMGIGLEGQPDREWLDEQASHFRSLGVRRFMLQILPHVETPPLQAAMTGLGMVRLRGWAKHVGRPGSAPEVDSEWAIEEVGREHASAWARVCAEGFGMPHGLRAWLEASFDLSSWYHYLAFSNGEPAACAAVFIRDAVATLAFAATSPSFRGRGAQSALIARRVHDAAARGCRWVVSETDEELPDRPNPSYHNVARLGLPVRYVRANWGPPKE